jgi:hypothetical protein
MRKGDVVFYTAIGTGDRYDAEITAELASGFFDIEVIIPNQAERLPLRAIRADRLSVSSATSGDQSDANSPNLQTALVRD